MTKVACCKIRLQLVLGQWVWLQVNLQTWIHARPLLKRARLHVCLLAETSRRGSRKKREGNLSSHQTPGSGQVEPDSGVTTSLAPRRVFSLLAYSNCMAKSTRQVFQHKKDCTVCMLRSSVSLHNVLL